MRLPPFRFILIAVACGACLLSMESRGQTSYPMTTRIEPTAVTRGHTVRPRRLGAGEFRGCLGVALPGAGLAWRIRAGRTGGPATGPDSSRGATARHLPGPGAARDRGTMPRSGRERSASPRLRESRRSAWSSWSTILWSPKRMIGPTIVPRPPRDSFCRPLPPAVSASSKTSIGLPSTPRKGNGSASRSGATVSRTRSTTCRLTSTRS